MRASSLWMAVVIVLSACLAAQAADAAAPGKPDGAAAVKPGEPTAVATIYCIGVKWPVKGDDNGNATCAVRYREVGAKEWSDALPLYRKPPVAWDVAKGIGGGRVPTGSVALPKWDRGTLAYATGRWADNYLAGSIFNLKPGTTYEVLLSLADPDGGLALEKTLSATTRVEPVIPEKGNVVEVAAEGGASALAKALASARPGDIISVHAGTYDGPFTIRASGTATQPIVLRAAGDGAVVMNGPGYKGEGGPACLQIDGSHVYVTGLDVRDASTAINIGRGRFTDREQWLSIRSAGRMQKDVVVTRCRTSQTQYAVTGTADECYIADNDFTGLAVDRPGIDWSEGEGVEVHGSGTVVCYNRMYHLADAVSIYDFTDNQDVYNNDAVCNSDDGIEVDYSLENNRVWDNRFWFGGNNGISFQPYIGGPVYIIRNEVIGSREGCSKDRYASSDVFLVNNTFIGHKPLPEMGDDYEAAPFDLPDKTWSRNNLYLIQDSTTEASVNVHPEAVARRTTDMDYDGISGPFIIGSGYGARNIDPALYPGSSYVSGDGLYVPIDAFRKASGALAHYTLVDPSKTFAAPLPAMRDWRKDGPVAPMLLSGRFCGHRRRYAQYPISSSDYAGKAPDLGAHELGRPAPHYGPRPVANAK